MLSLWALPGALRCSPPRGLLIDSRIAERSRRYGAGERLNRASNPASVLDYALVRLTIYTDFTNLEFHPMVETLHDHSGAH